MQARAVRSTFHAPPTHTTTSQFKAHASAFEALLEWIRQYAVLDFIFYTVINNTVAAWIFALFLYLRLTFRSNELDVQQKKAIEQEQSSADAIDDLKKKIMKQQQKLTHMDS